MRNSGARGEPYFKAEFDIEYDGVGVPTIRWHRDGFYDWSAPVRKNKPHGRRRVSRDAVRATEGGVR